MNTKDILMVATTALGTAVLTVATLVGGSMEAGSDAEKPSAKIEQPKFVQNGVEMTLAAKGNGPFKAGDQPEFELTAFNPTDKSASVAVDVQMEATSVADMVSRVLRMPTVVWEKPETFTISAGATMVLAVSSKAPLPANRLMTIYMKDGGSPAKGATGGNPGPNFAQKIFALSISTSTNAGVTMVAVPGVAATLVKQ